MTDRWNKKDGVLFDFKCILPCTASTVILEGSCVTVTTTQTDGEIEVAPSTVLGDGIGVATRAAAADGDTIPVLFYGVYKMMVAGTANSILMGSMVMNSITTTVAAVKDCGTWGVAQSIAFGGTSYILGMALCKGSTGGTEEIPILVGKCI
jgi:hypothetical protein